MPHKRIAIYHPDLPHSHTTPAQMTDRSFERVWKPKGWKPWTPAVAEAADKKGSK